MITVNKPSIPQNPIDPAAIMPDEVRPALSQLEPDPDDQESSGQDLFEDETASGHVLRPPNA